MIGIGDVRRGSRLLSPSEDVTGGAPASGVMSGYSPQLPSLTQ